MRKRNVNVFHEVTISYEFLDVIRISEKPSILEIDAAMNNPIS